MLIFQNETADKMVSVNINRNNKNTIFVKGVMDGATLFIELSPDNGVTWYRDPNDDVTEVGIKNIEISSNPDVRCQIGIESTGASTSITAHFI